MSHDNWRSACILHSEPDADLQGNVLEVSAGTGRNLPYYKYDNLKSLTLTDSSKYMLWHASQKYRDIQAAKKFSLPVGFFLSEGEKLTESQSAASVPTSKLMAQAISTEAAERNKSPSGEGEPSEVSSVFTTRTNEYAENSFDTVVDTFGLCSHADPVQVLKVTFNTKLQLRLVPDWILCNDWQS